MESWSLQVDFGVWASSQVHVTQVCNHNTRALIIRIGFGGPVYYNDNKEPPKIVLVIIKAPIGFPKTPCAQRVGTWSLKGSLYGYFN